MAVKCTLCDTTFSTQTNLNKHLRNVHKQRQKNIKSYDNNFSNIKCFTCDISFRFTRDLRYHLKTVHHEDMTEENLLFKNAQEFQCWLSHLKRTEYVKYGKRETKGKFYYDCHRSGRYEVKPSKLRKRALKSQGSCKIGYKCTSEIIVTVRDDGAHDVVYHGTHYGHEIDSRHIGVLIQNRSNINGKRITNSRFSGKLDSEEELLLEQSDLELDVLTNRYEHNMESSFQNLDAIKHEITDEADKVIQNVISVNDEGQLLNALHTLKKLNHLIQEGDSFDDEDCGGGCLVRNTAKQLVMFNKIKTEFISDSSCNDHNYI